MANNEYPRKLTFKAPDTDRLTEDAKEHVRKVTEEMTIPTLEDNIRNIKHL